MRLWNFMMIPYLPDNQLRGQWRECALIADGIQKNGTPNHMTRSEVMCDRCGKSKTLLTKNDIIISFAKIDLWEVGQHRTDAPQRIDLCEECYEKFVSFLEGGE